MQNDAFSDVHYLRKAEYDKLTDKILRSGTWVLFVFNIFSFRDEVFIPDGPSDGVRFIDLVTLIGGEPLKKEVYDDIFCAPGRYPFGCVDILDGNSWQEISNKLRKTIVVYELSKAGSAKIFKTFSPM